jgi:nitric oxide reductase NorD protein
MSEPEDVLIDAAHVAAENTVALWNRHSTDSEPDTLELSRIKQRLSLFLNASFGWSPRIVAAQPPRVPSFIVRWIRGTPEFAVRRRAFPSTDGRRIRLPREVPFKENRSQALTTYRLWSVEQMLRLERGTVDHLPEDETSATRWLYLLAEAANVDRRLTDTFPGLAERLHRARRLALKNRPDESNLNETERALEERLRTLLQASPETLPEVFPRTDDPSESRGWAERHGASIDSPDDFRGILFPRLWGAVDIEAAGPSDIHPGEGGEQKDGEGRSSDLERRPSARDPEPDEDDDKEGSFMVPLDDLHETAQDPMGLQRPVDREDEVDPDELAESLAEMEEGRLVRTSDPAREHLVSDDPPPRGISAPDTHDYDGIRYPEWDYRQSGYRDAAVTVRPQETVEGSASWVRETLRSHAALIQEVRRSFEQLKPERQRLRRQPDGPDIDLGAWVEAYADRKAGRPADDRLYRCVRPGRRDVAIHLLIDVSASTDSWIREQNRVIDVEKAALLVVCEALETLGDPYAISAFSGRGPEAVSSWMVKDFKEHRREQIRRRIAGLQPRSYTRAGAAIRHATAHLEQQSAHHPLLICLTDGKPNDVDRYEGRYGIEDTRQAVHEARLSGIDVFCLTIDRKAPNYMDRIFGPTDYAVVHRPALLPRVLARLVRRLLDG